MLKLHSTLCFVCALSLVHAVGQNPALEPVTPEQPTPIEPPIDDISSMTTTTPSEPFEPGALEPVESPMGPGGMEAGTDLDALAASVGGSTTDFQGEDVSAVLRLLARKANANIVVSDLVSQSGQTVTMRLQDKTAMEAIRIVVQAKGLLMDEIEGVYFVKTPEERAKEPTESAFYTFSYATAERAMPLLQGQLLSGVPPQFDVRTNTVFYREHKSNMENIALFLETIDKPTQQVMIEARLVEVNANPKQSYGINWAGTVGSSSGGMKVSTGGTVPVEDGGGANGLIFNEDTGSFTMGNFIGDTLQSAFGQFAILQAPQLSATLRLLNEDDDAEFIANPRIVTADNEKAEIKVTRNQPVPQLNFNEQTATAVFGGFEDKEYGNTLIVTPSINKDDFITMTVQPEISNKVGDETFSFAGAVVNSPIIDTRTLNSKVLIKSGDTLAIGGLLQDESNKGQTKVPVLGDIPVLGYLFQEHVNSRAKRNLLVFVTPTLIKSGYGTGLEDQVTGLHHSGEEYANPNGWRNNAKGAIRLVPTSERQLAADYPVPGAPLPPGAGAVNYKASAYGRER